MVEVGPFGPKQRAKSGGQFETAPKLLPRTETGEYGTTGYLKLKWNVLEL